MMSSFRRLVIRWVSGSWGGESEDPLRSLRKLVLKKFSLRQVRFAGPFPEVNLRFSERVVWLMRFGAF